MLAGLSRISMVDFKRANACSVTPYLKVRYGIPKKSFQAYKYLSKIFDKFALYKIKD